METESEMRLSILLKMMVNPDKFIGADETQYREYTYSIDDLPSFNGFQIKIVFTGTNQAKYPVVKNLRAIALA